MSEVAAGVFVAAGGAALGSYVSTAALRATRGEGAFWGRSRCDGCAQTLSFWRTTPLLSFVLARGVCSSCGTRINLAHPIGELAGVAVAILLWRAAPWPSAIWLGIMAAALLASSIIDAHSRRLPNALTAVVAAMAVALAAGHGALALMPGVIATAISAAVLLLLRQTFVAVGRDPGLGLGDVKLVGAFALWLGWQTPLMIASASLLGLVAMRIARPADGKLAFGPAIALAGWSIGTAMEIGWWPR